MLSTLTTIAQSTIDEIESDVQLLRHKSGAQILSIQNSDQNKSFAITFTTLPESSNGIAHILEHSVLCGSKNFPLKEPFVELLKGSQQTFLNAFTYPDKTSYPVASTNQRDFHNLMTVYLDAVFFPLLTKETLMQEGWHLHQEESDAHPVIKGVVYNEMKGAYSSPDRILFDTIQASLFPETSYRFDSGGDPLVIPSLSYEEFIAFHKKTYVPANALLCIAGDDDREETLALIDRYLLAVDPGKPVATHVQSPITHPIRRTVRSPISSTEDPKRKGMVALAWALAPTKDPELLMQLSLLSHCIAGTPASPLQQRLLGSALGEEVIGGGIESDLSALVFTIGLRGIDSNQSRTVEALIKDTLRTLVHDGIDRTMVEATFADAQFRLREQNSGSFPRGLARLYGILPIWQYGGDPIAALRFAAPLERLRKRVEAGEKVFEQLLQHYLLDNPHRVSVTLRPDASLQKKIEEKERRLLRRLIQASSDTIQKTTTTLLVAQNTPDSPEALATIPRLVLADVQTPPVTPPLEKKKAERVTTYHTRIATNGILYAALAFDLRGVAQSDLALLPLLARCITEMGTKSEDFPSIMTRIQTHTGGIAADPLSSAEYRSEHGVAKLTINAKVLPEKVDQLIALLADLLIDRVFFDAERLRQMIREDISTFESALLESGHAFVQSTLASKLHVASWFDECTGGASQLSALKATREIVEKQPEKILRRLESLLFSIIRAPISLSLTAGDDCEQAARVLHQWVESIPSEAITQETWNWQTAHADTIFTVPTRVNYVGLGARIAPEKQWKGSWIVAARYLRTSWLWEHVRMQGGAYGAFCSLDPYASTVIFASYRDPHSMRTIDAFRKSAEFLSNLSIDRDACTHAILGTISDFDRYQLPDALGFSQFLRALSGMEPTERLRLRREILATTREDLQEFGSMLGAALSSARVCAITSPERARDFVIPGAKTIPLL